MKNYFIISIIILSVVFCQRPERNEIITERHPNGLKKLVLVFEGTGINETLVGKYGFYENGLKSHIEFYNNNKKHGKSIFWNEEGTIIVEGTYKMGMMDGPWTYYHENGTKMGEGSFINGDESNRSESSGIPRNGRIGLWTFWYENGQKVEEMIFKNNNLIGIYEGWFNDGTKKLEYYFNDDGTRDYTKSTTRWYESGQKWFNGYIKTINDTTYVWNGLYTQWYENGQKKNEGTFKDGEYDGLWTYWYEDGREIIPIIPKFVMVRGGTFQMGSNSGDDDEKPVHSVTVSDFSMSKTEVTFEQYDVFCTLTSRDKPDDEGWGRGDRPVIKVSWHDAVAFCEWISTQTDKTVRLPTEAEWEYAARGGNKSKGYTYSGNKDLNAVGWYSDNCVDKTHPVAQKQPNELGLYDMSGNVFEWCSDRYSDYGSSQQTDPEGPTSGSFRILRGGSWFSYGNDCRVTNRGVITSGRSYGLGFRCVSSAQ